MKAFAIARDFVGGTWGADASAYAYVTPHAASLLRTARRYSLCADDAQDAYQRALEIFVRRADSLDPESVVVDAKSGVTDKAFVKN